MGEKSLKKYSIEEYLSMEETALEKHEFHNGEIIMMSGGTIKHGIIGGNINGEIREFLKTSNSSCTNIASDVKVWIEKTHSFLYPDGMVVCGEIETPEGNDLAINNPVLIIEVLSKSTEAYDRGDKFLKYCSLPSFKEYVLIHQDAPIVSTFFRADNASWNMVTTIGLDKTISLHSIEAEISMESIYLNINDLKEPII